MTTERDAAEEWLAGLMARGEIADYALVGSTFCFGTGRDIDFAVLLPKDGAWRPLWLDESWVSETRDAYENPEFRSYRKDLVNLIVMYRLDLYRKYLTAMEVCKALQLTRRADRVVACRIVRDGWSAEQARAVDVPGEQE